MASRQYRCSPGTTPPGITAGPSATLLPARHPLLQPDVPDNGKRWVHLRLQPCTSTPGTRRQNGRFYILGCLSGFCIFFCRNSCICLFTRTYSPTAYSRSNHGAPQPTVGRTVDQVRARAHCQVVTQVSLYLKNLLGVLFLPCLCSELSRLLEN